MIFKRNTDQLKTAVSLESIAGNIPFEDGTEMTSSFRLDTIAIYAYIHRYRTKKTNTRENLVLSFLIYVIILLFPPIYGNWARFYEQKLSWHAMQAI